MPVAKDVLLGCTGVGTSHGYRPAALIHACAHLIVGDLIPLLEGLARQP